MDVVIMLSEKETRTSSDTLHMLLEHIELKLGIEQLPKLNLVDS